MKARVERLYNELSPRYIRCYDNNGKTYDRYTVVFTKKRIGGGKYRLGQFIYVGMCKNPYHPLGFYQHGFSDCVIDHSSYSHLGKKIQFFKLPEECQKAIIEEYNGLWNISKKEYDKYIFKILDDFVNNELIPEHPELKRFHKQFDNILNNRIINN